MFVYLNLMHVSAYCALTPVYSRQNLMDRFCEENVLQLPLDEYESAFGALHLPSGNGASAYQLCACWAMNVIESAHRGGTDHGR